MIEIFTGFVDSLGSALYQTFFSLWNSFITIFPGLIAAIFIVIVGFVLGKVVKEIIVKILELTKLDNFIEEHNLASAIGGKNISVLIGSLVKWYIVAIFMIQAVDIIQLTSLSVFLGDIARFLPSILVAIAMIVIGLLLARYVRNAIEATTHQYKKTVAVALEIVIVYMAVVLALQSVNLNVTILINAFNIAFTAFALTIAIVAGIAFGFALKDDAKRLIKEFQKI